MRGGMIGVEDITGVRLSGMIPKEQNSLENLEKIRVTVVDITMPFSSMVLFMVKWAVASIPALTILLILGVFLLGLAGSVVPKMCTFFIKSLIWG
jgi:hypothetical protein